MLELFTHFAHVTFHWQHTKAAMLGLDTHKVTRLISQSEMVCATGAILCAHFPSCSRQYTYKVSTCPSNMAV